MNSNFKPAISVFHCINIFPEDFSANLFEENSYDLQIIQLPCSGMVKDVFLLKAFENGADAVVVLVCPEEQCRYVQGSIRARKRVEWVQELLDQIGLGARRLSIFNLPSGDHASVIEIMRTTAAEAVKLGRNPAMQQ